MAPVADEFKDGKKAVVDRAVRADFVKEGEGWKFERYQVYMVSLLCNEITS
jgi:hypothetical protein